MSDYRPPKDEIPGITTFLYEANRYREPHEFTNAWKWEEKNSERRKQLGIQANANEDELLDRIHALQNKIEDMDMTPELNRLHEEIGQLKSELAQSRTMASNFKKQNDELTLDKKDLTTALEVKKLTLSQYTEFIVKYGEHHPDCNIVDALEAGRMLDKIEKDACTCGWSSAKLNVLQVKQ